MIKKILAVMAAVMLAASARAQVFIGGNIGLSVGSGGSGVGINIAPEIGYHVNQYLTVGGLLSYQSRYNTFGATPYLRFNFVTIGDRVRLFVAATAPMRFAHEYRSFGANVRPGLTIRVAEKMALMVHVGTFGYQYVNSAGSISSGWIARLNSDNISVGFCIDL